MAKYRIEVGHAHGVRPGNIVGAIANESGLSGSDIGGIDIQTHFSTVDLPHDLSDEQIQGLRQLRVAGQVLRISKWDRGGNSRFDEKPRRFNKKKGGKPSWKKTRKRDPVSAS
jgi:ATP-dependent RNA helicase DeaD